jgi:rhomboid family GlyGly-CTERM serine protease
MLMPLLLSLLCALLYLGGEYLPWVDEFLVYRRAGISEGELWRLLSGNLLHTNHWHLLMNLAGLWVIVLLYADHLSRAGLGWLFVSLCLLEGLGLYGFYPELSAYVGLSGVLHGLFGFGAIMDVSRGIKSGWLLLLGVIVKVGHEQLFGASDQVRDMIGARVATESHLVGLLGGLLCAALFLGYRHRRRLS